MVNGLLESGIPAVGSIPWGTHFCQFYRTQQDLIETLIPYFKAGLENNECCLWVTSETLEAGVAEKLLRDVIPDLDKYLNREQLQIVPITDWYTAGDVFDADAVLQSWIEKEKKARASGFSGLRLTGDTFWLERSGWNDFMDYENKVNGAFHRFKLVALCTYSTERCTAEDMIDVCCHHEFALARRQGDWKLLESSSLKTAKQHLNNLNNELEARVQKRTEELNTALRSRDEFLAMLGHELRNPLAPIRHATEIIRSMTPPESPLTDSIKILGRQVDHVTRLVDDLLDIARITHGHISMACSPMLLRDVVQQAVEISLPYIRERSHQLSVDIDPTICINADATRMAQVFGNLLHNAAKYSQEGGAITIHACIEQDMVLITVKDTGLGIPPDRLSSIFDLFSQLPRSLARSDGGLGIGLTLVKQIVEMHHGQVEAKSDGVGQGAAFTVSLPVLVTQTEVQIKPESSPNRVSSGTHILIVDDNTDASESLAMLLRISGYTVDCAADGLGGLQIAKALHPDVALLDIGLPGLNGYEVAQYLRADPATSTMKLIAVTGYGQQADLSLAERAGFDAHLLKPVALHQLLAAIEGEPDVPPSGIIAEPA